MQGYLAFSLGKSPGCLCARPLTELYCTEPISVISQVSTSSNGRGEPYIITCTVINYYDASWLLVHRPRLRPRLWLRLQSPDVWTRLETVITAKVSKGPGQ